MYKFSEVIDLGDGVTAYYQGQLADGNTREPVPNLHVVTLRGGDHPGPTRVWCDKCGAVFNLKFNKCPSCVTTHFIQKDNVDEAGESAIISAGTEVTVLFEDENGVMVELLDKSASFYIDKEFLSDTPPLFGGEGWDYGGGVDADFPKPDLPCLGGDGMLPGFGQVPDVDGQLRLLDVQ